MSDRSVICCKLRLFETFFSESLIFMEKSKVFSKIENIFVRVLCHHIKSYKLISEKVGILKKCDYLLYVLGV